MKKIIPVALLIILSIFITIFIKDKGSNKYNEDNNIKEAKAVLEKILPSAEKSKTYALKIKDNYLNSIYNNSKIQEIISL